MNKGNKSILLLLAIGAAGIYMLTRKKATGVAGMGDAANGPWPDLDPGSDLVTWSTGNQTTWGPWFNKCLKYGGSWAPDGSACISVKTGRTLPITVPSSYSGDYSSSDLSGLGAVSARPQTCKSALSACQLQQQQMQQLLQAEQIQYQQEIQQLQQQCATPPQPIISPSGSCPPGYARNGANECVPSNQVMCPWGDC
jgi:hypothetical protein